MVAYSESFKIRGLTLIFIYEYYIDFKITFTFINDSKVVQLRLG